MPSGELPNVTIFSRCKIRRDCVKTWPVGTQKWGLPNGYKAAPAPCTRIVSQPFFLMQSFRHSNACACGIRRRAGKMLCNSSTEGFEPSGMVVGHPHEFMELSMEMLCIRWHGCTDGFKSPFPAFRCKELPRAFHKFKQPSQRIHEPGLKRTSP